MYSYFDKMKSLERGDVYVYLVHIDGALKFSRMCMDIEFLHQVLGQKDAHVIFTVGMVV